MDMSVAGPSIKTTETVKSDRLLTRSEWCELRSILQRIRQQDANTDHGTLDIVTAACNEFNATHDATLKITQHPIVKTIVF